MIKHLTLYKNSLAQTTTKQAHFWGNLPVHRLFRGPVDTNVRAHKCEKSAIYIAIWKCV